MTSYINITAEADSIEMDQRLRNKVQFIKSIRQLTGLGLKESKDHADLIFAGNQAYTRLPIMNIGQGLSMATVTQAVASMSQALPGCECDIMTDTTTEDNAAFVYFNPSNVSRLEFVDFLDLSNDLDDLFDIDDEYRHAIIHAIKIGLDAEVTLPVKSQWRASYVKDKLREMKANCDCYFVWYKSDEAQPIINANASRETLIAARESYCPLIDFTPDDLSKDYVLGVNSANAKCDSVWDNFVRDIVIICTLDVIEAVKLTRELKENLDTTYWLEFENTITRDEVNYYAEKIRRETGVKLSIADHPDCVASSVTTTLADFLEEVASTIAEEQEDEPVDENVPDPLAEPRGARDLMIMASQELLAAGDIYSARQILNCIEEIDEDKEIDKW